MSFSPTHQSLTTHQTTTSLHLFKVWWQTATLFIYFYNNRSNVQYLYILLLSSLLPLGRGSPLGSRAEIRSGACLAASRRTTIRTRLQPLSHAAPYLNHALSWSEPRRTLLSHAAPSNIYVQQLLMLLFWSDLSPPEMIEVTQLTFCPVWAMSMQKRLTYPHLHVVRGSILLLQHPANSIPLDLIIFTFYKSVWGETWGQN